MPTTSAPRPFRINNQNPDRYPADTGCHLHPACLSCPRPVCIHDEEEAGRIQAKRTQRGIA